MHDPDLLREQLDDMLEALERVTRRFQAIETAGDFARSPEGVDRFDAICMVLFAAGEELKSIDRKTEGELPARYPEVDWPRIKGIAAVIAEGYFDIDREEVFGICRDDVPVLIETVRKMIGELG